MGREAALLHPCDHVGVKGIAAQLVLAVVGAVLILITYFLAANAILGIAADVGDTESWLLGVLALAFLALTVKCFRLVKRVA